MTERAEALVCTVTIPFNGAKGSHLTGGVPMTDKHPDPTAAPMRLLGFKELFSSPSLLKSKFVSVRAEFRPGHGRAAQSAETIEVKDDDELEIEAKTEKEIKGSVQQTIRSADWRVKRVTAVTPRNCYLLTPRSQKNSVATLCDGPLSAVRSPCSWRLPPSFRN